MTPTIPAHQRADHSEKNARLTHSNVVHRMVNGRSRCGLMDPTAGQGPAVETSDPVSCGHCLGFPVRRANRIEGYVVLEHNTYAEPRLLDSDIGTELFLDAADARAAARLAKEAAEYRGEGYTYTVNAVAVGDSR